MSVCVQCGKFHVTIADCYAQDSRSPWTTLSPPIIAPSYLILYLNMWSLEIKLLVISEPRIFSQWKQISIYLIRSFNSLSKEPVYLIKWTGGLRYRCSYKSSRRRNCWNPRREGVVIIAAVIAAAAPSRIFSLFPVHCPSNTLWQGFHSMNSHCCCKIAKIGVTMPTLEKFKDFICAFGISLKGRFQ